jgi:hypothetical protein
MSRSRKGMAAKEMATRVSPFVKRIDGCEGKMQAIIIYYGIFS